MVRGKTKKGAELATTSTQAALPEKKIPRSLRRKFRNLKRSKQKKLKLKNLEGTSQSQVSNEEKNKTTAKVGTEGNLNISEIGKEKERNMKISEIGKEKERNMKISEIGKEKERNLKISENGKEKESNNKKIGENGKEKKSNLNNGKGKESNLNISGSGKKEEDNLNTSESGKEKNILNNKKKKNTPNSNKKHEQIRVEAPNSEAKIGGLIFMCNGKTKPDCFRYKVMALPSGKKEAVLSIKPGIKLFLYDFDLKLLYGIYEAFSAGGMKLEPAAFNGAFPAQVRFRIYEDCLPLPESVFKKAIKENYDERTNKFKTELTSKQVKKLRSLFRPIRQSHMKDHPVIRQSASSSDPLFVTEEEYRSHGLRSVVHGLRQDAVSYVPVPESYGISQERDQVFRSPASIYKDTFTQGSRNNPVPLYKDVSSSQDAPVSGPFSTLRDPEVKSEPLFLSESEYRKYGLRGRSERSPMLPATSRVQSNLDSYQESHYHSQNYVTSSDPYSRSTSGAIPMIAATSRPISDLDSYRENQYYSHNYNVTSSDLYSRSAVRPTITYESYPHSTVTEAYRSELHSASGSYTADYGLPRSVADEGLYSSYASRDLSEYNRRGNVDGQSELASAPVSSRYSFAGAAYSLR